MVYFYATGSTAMEAKAVTATTESKGERRRPGPPPKTGDAVRRRRRLSVRLRPAVQAEVETRAGANRRSMSEEVEALVEASLRQDELLGGSAARRILLSTAAAFCTAGQRGTDGDATWTADLDRYIAGTAAAVDALLRGIPATDRTAVRLMYGAVESRLLTWRRQLDAEREAEAPAKSTKRRPAA